MPTETRRAARSWRVSHLGVRGRPCRHDPTPLSGVVDMGRLPARVRDVAEGTVESRVTGVPVRTLKVEVVAGPDRGLASTSTESTITVGTAEGNDLRLTDSTVSRYHLELQCRGDRIVVIDPGSTNGTAVGPALVERGSVPPGTVLELGKTQLRVSDGQTVTVEIHRGESLGELYGGR